PASAPLVLPAFPTRRSSDLSPRFHVVAHRDAGGFRVNSQTTWSFFIDHRDEIVGATLDHLTLVIIAMLIAIFIGVPLGMFIVQRDRKSTRLNSSHQIISYAV